MQAERPLALPPLTQDTVYAESRALLKATRTQLGFIPNLYARLAHSPGLFNAYQQGSTAFRNGSGFNAVEQELVLLAISLENSCEYCVAAHSLLADRKSGVPVEMTDALRNGAALPDAHLQALTRFTRHMVQSRGLPSGEELESFLAAGYRETQVLDIVLAIAVKTISNYSNHLFHTPLDAAFESRRWHDPRA